MLMNKSIDQIQDNYGLKDELGVVKVSNLLNHKGKDKHIQNNTLDLQRTSLPLISK